MNKKIVALASAGALTLGLLSLASPALAEDSAPTPEVTSSDATAPAATPSDQQPTVPGDTQAPSTPTSPGTSTPQPTTQTSDPGSPTSGSPDVQSLDTPSDAPQSPTSPEPEKSLTSSGPATVGTEGRTKPELITEWHTWLAPGTTAPTGHVSLGAEYFPQTSLGAGQIAPQCEQVVQQDKYTGSRQALDALYAAGLTWTNGHASDNDAHGVKVVDWTVVVGDKCPPVIPPAQTCVPASGDWYSEDVAPVQTETGLLFQGQGAAVDWYHPVSGNLQGFTTQSITFTGVAGYQPSVTLVLNRNGTSGYANLVAEWYMNGGSASTDGTFTVTPSTLFWTNKIASGAGSQSDPQPLSFFVQQWPNNQLLAIGPHLGSAQQADTHSTVTAVSGCVTDSFVPVKPDAIVTHDQSETTDCADGIVIVHHSTTTVDWAWDAESAGYVKQEPVTTADPDTTRKATAEECPVSTPTPTPSPSQTATPAPAALDTTAPTEQVLAHTGSNTQNLAPWAWGAGFLVLGGIATVTIVSIVSRKRAAK